MPGKVRMNNNNKLQRLNSLWVEGRLSYIERLCLQSGLDAGHEVRLYTYYDVENVPDGVDIRDGREILPESKLLKYDLKRSKSYALGANIFRYEMMNAGVGIWVDTDVYILEAINLDTPYLFGYEAPGYINNAVLYAPPGSDLMKELLNLINADLFCPPWWTLKKRFVQKLRSYFSMQKPIQKAGWGTTGPRALTYYTYKLGLEKYVLPIDVFYPINYLHAEQLFEPSSFVQSFITTNTRAIHLWNEKIKHKKMSHPPEGSLIYQLCNKHNIWDKVYS